MAVRKPRDELDHPNKAKGTLKAQMEKKEIHVSQDMVERMAALGCTDIEIAAIIGCSRSTLRNNFQPLMAKGRASMSYSIRRKMFELAMAGNMAALMVLDKKVCQKYENPDEGILESQPTESDNEAREVLKKILLRELERDLKECNSIVDSSSPLLQGLSPRLLASEFTRTG